jgi:hypothetical protein
MFSITKHIGLRMPRGMRLDVVQIKSLRPSKKSRLVIERSESQTVGGGSGKIFMRDSC